MSVAAHRRSHYYQQLVSHLRICCYEFEPDRTFSPHPTSYRCGGRMFEPIYRDFHGMGKA